MKSKDFLTELSPETLASYKKKAGAQASELDKSAFDKDTPADVAKQQIAKANKRFSGIVKATKKEFGKKKAEVEEGQIYSGGNKEAGVHWYEPRTVPNQNELDKESSSILEGIEQEEIVAENLRKWFKEKWVRFGPDGKIRGACARGSSKEGKPKCLPQSKAHSLGKKGRKYAAAKKRREDPNPERRGPAKNVATKKKSNEGQLNELSPELLKRASAAAQTKYDQAADYGNKLSDTEAQALMKHYGYQQSKFAQGAKLAQNRSDRASSLAKIGMSDVAKRKTGVAEGSLEEIDRRGFLKGMGAAALGTAGMKAQAGQSQDLGNGFVLVIIEVGGHTVKAVLDTQTNTYYTLNRKEDGSAILRTPAPFLIIKDGQTKPAMSVGPETNVAMKKAGLEKIQEGVAEDLNEFSPHGFNGGDDDDEPDEYEILHKLASQWWNGTEQQMIKAQKTLEAMGWEIGEDEGYDQGGVFVVRSNDEHGKSYISWPHEDLSLNEACWKGYHKEGMKTMFGKKYPNCVKNKKKKKANEDQAPMFTPEMKCPHCNGEMVSEELMNEKKDACYYKVKSRYKVWPSAYASGALVKCRKKGASNWGTGGKKNENAEQPKPKLKYDEYMELANAIQQRFNDAIRTNNKELAKEIEQERIALDQRAKQGLTLENLGMPYPGTYEQETLPYRTKGQKRTQSIAFETKQIEEKWSQKYKKSINCNNPKGFSQRAHCQGRKKKK